MPNPILREVTVALPADLLNDATTATGQDITLTICLGLQVVAARDTYRRLREPRGRVHIELALEELRRD